MVELAQTQGSGHVQIKDIAQAHGIPQHYLEQLLVALKKRGLVESRRGAQGGYTLASPPAQIRVSDILTCLDGKLQVSADPKKAGALAFFWTEIENGIAGLIDRSLEDLLLDRQRHENSFVYTI